MNSRRHGGEEALARIGCARLVSSSPLVLVGGLGFGFTLRAALDVLGPTASLVVSELLGAVVQCNRESVAALAIWSAGPQGGFLRRLRKAGFRPSVEKPGRRQAPHLHRGHRLVASG